MSDFDHALVIVVDDLGADKVGAYAGDIENPDETRPDTPTLDLLAEAGVRFTDAWSSPVCSPTRATLYTGTYAYRNGIGSVISSGSSMRLATSPDTIGKLASDAGLDTALFGKWHLGTTSRTPTTAGTVNNYQEYPVQLGFAYFAGNMGAAFESYTHSLYLVSAPVGNTSRYRTTASWLETSATDRTTEDAIGWMDTRSGRRHLGVVAYNLAHATANRGSADWSDAAQACGSTPSGDVADQRVAVECVDASIEELLRGTPDLEHTLVVLVGDNGTPDEAAEGTFADGRGKGTVYENGIHVPLVVADGAAVLDRLDDGSASGTYTIPAGEEVTDPVGVVDVYATLADYLDLASPTCTPGVTCGVDSVSLRAVIEGGPSGRDDVWSEGWTHSASGYAGEGAVRVDDVKLVISVSGRTCDYELYDLAADPWELDDRYDDPAYAGAREALRARLAIHKAAMTHAWAAGCR